MKYETTDVHQRVDRTPRNKQTALVIAKAPWLCQPVQEATFAPTEQELHEARLFTLRKINENAEQENIKRQIVLQHEANERRLKLQKSQGKRKQKCLWVTRHLKQLHKQMGWPKPTSEEIQAMKKAQPNYGKPLWHPDQKQVGGPKTGTNLT